MVVAENNDMNRGEASTKGGLFNFTQGFRYSLPFSSASAHLHPSEGESLSQ